jgi:hypothetical protein
MTEPMNQGTVPIKADNVRSTHHAEIVVFTRDTQGPGATGVCYNNLGLPDEVSDTQFDASFRALDPDSPASTFHGVAVWMNGPRRALMSSFTGAVSDGGKVTDVADIPMRTVATVHVPELDLFFSSERPPYTEITVGRTTEWVFDHGREVAELVAPNGNVYVMQSCSQHVDPGLTLDQRGGGDAHIVFGELENNYQRVDR